MLDLAMKPEEAFRAPLNTTKLAPVTATKHQSNRDDKQDITLTSVLLFTFFDSLICFMTPTRWRSEHQFLLTLTCSCLSRHAVDLGLIVSFLILGTNQVRVGLRAETGSNTDDVFVWGIHHLLHLENTIHSKPYVLIAVFLFLGPLKFLNLR